jgi:hypothetical protein
VLTHCSIVLLTHHANLLGLHVSSEMTAGDLIVGTGTLALAAFTLWLAFSTRSSARAAERAIDESDMPFVLPTPVPREDTTGQPVSAGQLWDDLMQALTPVEIRKVLWGGQDQLLIRLWNVGAGPAIVRDVRLQAQGSAADLLDLPPREIPVGVNQAADTHVPLHSWPQDCAVALRVYYSHSNGKTYVTVCDAAIKGDHLVCQSYKRERAGTRRERPARARLLYGPVTPAAAP